MLEKIKILYCFGKQTETKIMAPKMITTQNATTHWAKMEPL